MYVYLCVCVCFENLCFLGFCFWGFFLHEHFAFDLSSSADDECVVVDEKDEEVDFACLPLELLLLLCCCCCKFTHSFQSRGGKGKK